MSDEPSAENETAPSAGSEEAPAQPAEAVEQPAAASVEAESSAAVEEPQGGESQPQPQAQAERPASEEPSPPADRQPSVEAAAPAAAAEAELDADEDEGEEEQAPSQPRVKPEVPGLHLEVDIVPEGADPLGRGEPEDPYATDPYALEEEPAAEPAAAEAEPETSQEPISGALIDLAAGARYRATGKRKTAVARVILKPGDGSYQVNGRTLEEYVPRATLQRNVRQALETVGLQEQMDVSARVHGGGISAQAGALRHGVARALIEADPALRGELKRRGFLTRDARVKERKKAGLKKARKRPQFSKR